MCMCVDIPALTSMPQPLHILETRNTTTLRASGHMHQLVGHSPQDKPEEESSTGPEMRVKAV